MIGPLRFLVIPERATDDLHPEFDVVEGRRIEGLRFIWEASPDYLVRPWLAKRRFDLLQ